MWTVCQNFINGIHPENRHIPIVSYAAHRFLSVAPAVFLGRLWYYPLCKTWEEIHFDVIASDTHPEQSLLECGNH